MDQSCNTSSSLPPLFLSSSLMASPSSSAQLSCWSRGDQVEVQIREYGFEDSYYPAFVIARFPPEIYLVQFRTLEDEEDETKPLCQFALKDDIRRVPLDVVVPDFAVGDIVNVNARDGRWKGRVIRRVGALFEVHFPTTNERDFNPFASLRIHKEFSQWS